VGKPGLPPRPADAPPNQGLAVFGPEDAAVVRKFPPGVEGGWDGGDQSRLVTGPADSRLAKAAEPRADTCRPPRPRALFSTGGLSFVFIGYRIVGTNRAGDAGRAPQARNRPRPAKAPSRIRWGLRPSQSRRTEA